MESKVDFGVICLSILKEIIIIIIIIYSYTIVDDSA